MVAFLRKKTIRLEEPETAILGTTGLDDLVGDKLNILRFGRQGILTDSVPGELAMAYGRHDVEDSIDGDKLNIFIVKFGQYTLILNQE